LPAEIVDLVARSDRFAPHFHLPLQRDNRMLEAMRRPHDRTILFARRRHSPRIPHASIGSDIIVGFPGETVRSQLCRYLERSPLTHIHVFPYRIVLEPSPPRCATRCPAPSSA
jgi:threonylcarbamoyladenosine tRNA methylthiotransferase MtaB